VTALIALGAFIGGGSWDYPLSTKSSIPDLLFTMNVMLLLFNLLPAFPMDGGRVLRALLATHMSYARATQVAATVGQGFAFVFGFLGLLWNPFLIFIALFVYIGATQEAALAQMKDVSRRFPVSSAMVREFRTLVADATLEEAVDALLATSQHDFPVMDATGNVAGLLTRHDLIAALRKNDPTLRVGDVMRRDNGHTIRGCLSHHAGVRLSGRARAGSHETAGRLAHAGERHRINDGAIGDAAAPSSITESGAI
jgi:CBS domain-containing protein